MSLYDKKLYIKKTDGNIQTANLYTDKNDVGSNYLTFKDNGNTVYSVLDRNGNVDFFVKKNGENFNVKNTLRIISGYKMSDIYTDIFYTMTSVPNDVDWYSYIRQFNSLESMFVGCKSLTTIPQLDTSNVTVMDMMFSNCKSLTTIPLLNTSNVTNMITMFGDCTSLTSIPQLNTSKATRMGYMFKNCQSLTTIPQLDTSKNRSFGSMFKNCQSLTTIPIFDIGNVFSTSGLEDMIKGTKVTHITFKNKPANLEVTPEILGKPDVQITFI